MCLRVAGAVDKEHICALGLCAGDARKLTREKVADVVNIGGDDLAQLAEPLPPLGSICAGERVHGKHVHLVIMGKRRLLFQPFAQHFVIHNMIAADQTRKVEGFGGRIERDGAVFRIGAYRLRRDMLIAGQGKIRPDLVADHHHIVLSEQLHCLLQLPALPDSAAGIVRRADDGGVNLMLHDLFFHVDIVHAPDTGAVLFERAVDDVIAVVFQAAGKADVGRAQNEDLVAARAEDVQRRHNAAQHAVFIADMLRQQALHTILRPLPVDDGVKIRLRRAEVAE